MDNKLENALNKMSMNKNITSQSKTPMGMRWNLVKINQYGNILKNYSENRNRMIHMPERDSLV